MVIKMFLTLNLPEDSAQYESITIIHIASLVVSKSKYYLQEYLDNYVYKNLNTQMINFI